MTDKHFLAETSYLQCFKIQKLTKFTVYIQYYWLYTILMQADWGQYKHMWVQFIKLYNNECQYNISATETTTVESRESNKLRQRKITVP